MISVIRSAAPARDREADVDRELRVDAGRGRLAARDDVELPVGPRDDVGHGLADLGRENFHQVGLGDQPRHEQDLAERHAGLRARLECVGERALGDQPAADEDHAELLVAAIRARPHDRAVLDDEAAHERRGART